MHIEDKVGLLGLEPWVGAGHIENGYGEDEEEEIGGEVEGIRHGFWVSLLWEKEGFGLVLI
jgi:hypothetical protein